MDERAKGLKTDFEKRGGKKKRFDVTSAPPHELLPSRGDATVSCDPGGKGKHLEVIDL